MSSVLGIALTYFRMVTLQRWLNLAGLLLLAIAAVIGAVGETLLAAAFPLLPLGAMKLPGLVQQQPWLSGMHVVAFGLGAWVVFGVWYLLAGRIRPPIDTRPATSMSSGNFLWLMGGENAGSAPLSADRARFYYLLGCGSYRLYVVTGMWTAAVYLAVGVLTPGGRTGHNALLLFILPFLTFHCATMGFTTARRARLLWMRPGEDRDGLFSLGEKLGLRASLITWGITAGAITAFMVATEPEESAVVLCICSFALLILQMAFAHPQGGIPARQPIITLLFAGAALLPLRWHAQRQWHGLDWRLIKPPRLDWRRT